jgi:hypothetical protein
MNKYQVTRECKVSRKWDGVVAAESEHAAQELVKTMESFSGYEDSDPDESEYVTTVEQVSDDRETIEEATARFARERREEYDPLTFGLQFCGTSIRGCDRKLTDTEKVSHPVIADALNRIKAVLAAAQVVLEKESIERARRKNNEEKMQTFAWMNERGIATAEVEFSGGGDEGGADRITFRYTDESKPDEVVDDLYGNADPLVVFLVGIPHWEYHSFAGEFTVNGTITVDAVDRTITGQDEYSEASYEEHEYDWSPDQDDDQDERQVA